MAALAAFLLLLPLAAGSVQAQAFGSAFTYQGGLVDSGSPANASYDFIFTLLDDASAGSTVAGPLSVDGVSVAEGLFTVELDFGAGAFDGNRRWLEIQVSPAGAGTYETLSPRQELTPAAYALYAAEAGSLAGFDPASAWNLAGNSATTPGTDFLGTTDATNLEIHVDSGGSGGQALRVEPATDSSGDFAPNVVAGGSQGLVNDGAAGAFIGGSGDPNGGTAMPNQVFDDYGAVVGGFSNTAGSSGGVPGNALGAGVFAGTENTASAARSAVLGGRLNVASGGRAAIAGGQENTASGGASGVMAGEGNTAGNSRAAVLGGAGNDASAGDSAVAGGAFNAARGMRAIVAGGISNTASDQEAAVVGGGDNTASGGKAAVIGGANNTASGLRAAVVGGRFNEAAGANSLAGGQRAGALHDGAFVWADTFNADFDSTATDQFLVRASNGVGVNTNAPVADLTVQGEFVSGDAASNIATGANAAALGGDNNTASRSSAAVVGGNNNFAGGNDAAVLGGNNNSASFDQAAVVGGGSNTASGSGAAVVGGDNNTADGNQSAVVGGQDNEASGVNSLAAGRHAGALHNGAFVWADHTTDADFDSTAADQFLVRASGGMGINTNAPVADLTVQGELVSGAVSNAATGGESAVLGGFSNTASGAQAVVAGGSSNAAIEAQSVVLGGFSNSAIEAQSVVLGGFSNTASEAQSAVLGGFSSAATGAQSVVLGGQANLAAGTGSAVLGGFGNDASGARSVAAGAQAEAMHDNAFVWSDGTSAPFTSQAANTFLVEASGGVGVNTNAPGAALHIGDTGAPAFDGIMFADGTFQNTAASGDGHSLDADDGAPVDALYVDADGEVGVGTLSPSADLTVNGEFVSGNANNNSAVGLRSAVLGGNNNIASGDDSAILGGRGNTVSRAESLAAGVQARALHPNTFVWSDGTSAPFESTASDQFLIEASGGVGIGTNAPASPLHVASASNGQDQGIRLSNGSGNSAIYHENGDLIIRKLNRADQLVLDTGGNVGVGTNAPQAPLHVSASLTGSGVHVAEIENTDTGTDADGLRIRLGLSGNPGGGNNFITFSTASGSVGAVEGNGSGGVTNASAGSDYAEFLPRLDPAEEIAPGDVVGVFGGLVSKRVEGADWVMAVSTAPNTLGNMPRDEADRAFMEKVAFLGQAPVKVRGPVAFGDYIVASGREDGSAVAVAPEDIKPEQGRLIVGRAWEASKEKGAKLVNAAVGIPEASSTTMALTRRVDAQQARIDAQSEEIAVLRAENIRQLAEKDALAAKVVEQEERLARLEALLLDGNK